MLMGECPGGLSVVTKVLRRGRQEDRRRYDHRSEAGMIGDQKLGNVVGGLLEAGRDKEADSPPRASRRSAAPLTHPL